MAKAGRSLVIDILLRMSLWISLPLHLGAAYVLARPGLWLGQQLGLPAAVHPLYAALPAFLLALLGCACAWLALQRRPTQPLLAVAALAQLGVFIIILGLWLFAHASSGLAAAGCVELLLALLWLGWLQASTPTEPQDA